MFLRQASRWSAAAGCIIKLPAIGSHVRITGDSKWKGKTGELVSRGKTRCHVRLDDRQFPLPAYVLIGEVEVVASA